MTVLLCDRLTTRLHKANFPDDFFTSGSDLLSSMRATQSSGPEPGQDQQTPRSEAKFHDLPQGIAGPGYVALATGLTAADKVC